MRELMSGERKISIANGALERRGLITVVQHATERQIAGIALTIGGYDLCMKYSHWFAKSGAWFEEYRNHWISLVLSFLGGVMR